MTFVFRRDIWYASSHRMRIVITRLVSGLFLSGTFHAAAAAATPTVLSPTAGMTTFPIHGAVTQPTVFSPNALQPFAGSSLLPSVTCLSQRNNTRSSFTVCRYFTQFQRRRRGLVLHGYFARMRRFELRKNWWNAGVKMTRWKVHGRPQNFFQGWTNS